MSSGGQWDGLSNAELTAIARELRRMADELAREVRRRKQEDRQGEEELRRLIRETCRG